jgi:hypothetical protein
MKKRKADALMAAVRTAMREEFKLFYQCEHTLRRAAGLAELASRRLTTRTKSAQGRRRRRKK